MLLQAPTSASDTAHDPTSILQRTDLEHGCFGCSHHKATAHSRFVVMMNLEGLAPLLWCISKRAVHFVSHLFLLSSLIAEAASLRPGVRASLVERRHQPSFALPAS